MFLAQRTKEEGQVMTRAMAISIGGSSVLPWVSHAILQRFDLGILEGLLGASAGLFIPFFLVGPIYLLTVALLRIALALRLIVLPLPLELPRTRESEQVIPDVRKRQLAMYIGNNPGVEEGKLVELMIKYMRFSYGEIRRYLVELEAQGRIRKQDGKFFLVNDVNRCADDLGRSFIV